MTTRGAETNRVLGGLVLLGLLAAARPAASAPVDPAFTTVVHLAPTGQAGTTAMAWAPDGSNRLFYTRQIGQLNVVVAGVLVRAANPTPVFTDTECGVLGLAFDPHFSENHYLYLFVTASSTEQRIVRYSVDGNAATDPTPVVTGLPTRGVNHNAGGLGFGPDGKLYFSIGDLGNFTGAGANLTLASAKVHRINVDGSAPEDNPFFDGDGPNDDRIWALGFRNPFSFTWQPATDRLWVNVAGGTSEQSFSPLAGDNAGWASYENTQPAPFIQPRLSYPTGNISGAAIAANGAVRTNGIATFTTALKHGLHVGGRVTVGGVSDVTFNGTAFVTEVPSPTSFAVAQTGPDAMSGGGSASPLDLGSAITGGTFWDSSSVPAAYRGNFFFGDYVSGNIARVTFDDDNRVASFDLWDTAPGKMIDMAVGPDGDLYYTTFEGGVYHMRYQATQQGIVVSQLHARVAEGSQSVFGVRLAIAPTAPVVVSLERTAGDADIETEEGELTFDASNWSVPQAVHVVAAHDDDAAQDTAKLTLSAPDVSSEIVDVRVTDDDPLAIIVAPIELDVAAGASEEVSVTLNGSPTAPVAVSVATDDGSVLTPTPDTLHFDSKDWATPHVFTVAAPDAPVPPLDEVVTISGPHLIAREVRVHLIPAAPEDEGGTSGNAAGGPSEGGTTDGSGGAPPAHGGNGNSGATSVSSSLSSEGCGCRVPRGSGSASKWQQMVLAALLVLGACATRKKA